MRIVVVSDTHGRHEEYGVLEGDVLIHCGDGSESSAESVEALDEWFGRQRFDHVLDHVLAVGGNHDFEILRRVRAGTRVFSHARFLLDETVEIGELHFHGSPRLGHTIGVRGQRGQIRSNFSELLGEERRPTSGLVGQQTPTSPNSARSHPSLGHQPG